MKNEQAHMSEDCNCTIEKVGDYEEEIEYCSLHKAAPEMLAELKRLTEQGIGEGVTLDDLVWALNFSATKELIAKAEGGNHGQSG